VKLETQLTSPSRPYALCLTATIPRHSYSDEEAERYALLRLLLPVVHKTSTDLAVELGLVKDFEIKVLKFSLDDKYKIIPAGNKAKRWLQTEADRYAYLNKLVTTAATARGELMDGVDSKASIDKADAFLLSQLSLRANFIYNLPSKTRLAKKCLDRLHIEDNRVVVFCGSIEQANNLCGEAVYHSKSTRIALDRFQSMLSSLLGTVKALNEGKNLSKPTHGLIVQVDSVMRNLIQRIGRLIRINYENLEEKAMIVILVAADTKDEDWFNRSIVDFDTKRISYHTVKPPDYVSA
jgi:superfamily II DNA or RNA helicase